MKKGISFSGLFLFLWMSFSCLSFSKNYEIKICNKDFSNYLSCLQVLLEKQYPSSYKQHEDSVLSYSNKIDLGKYIGGQIKRYLSPTSHRELVDSCALACNLILLERDAISIPETDIETVHKSIFAVANIPTPILTLSYIQKIISKNVDSSDYENFLEFIKNDTLRKNARTFISFVESGD